MKNSIKKMSMVTTFVIFSVFGFGNAMAATIEGSVQGLNCMLKEEICPIDNKDPHIAAENAFVVVSGDNNYHFVPNLDQKVLSRYLSEKVRVTGDLTSKYKAITADKFEVYADGFWKTKWTAEQERQERWKELKSGGNRQ